LYENYWQSRLLQAAQRGYPHPNVFHCWVAIFAILAAITDAFADRTMALCLELKPAPRTFFSITVTLLGCLSSFRLIEKAQAQPRHPPPITTVLNVLAIINLYKKMVNRNY
jgi:hypothetical protein